MAVPTTCPPSAGPQYRPLLGALRIARDEEAQVLPVLSHLDGLDGACDGKLSNVTPDDLKWASQKIDALTLFPQRRLELQNALGQHLAPDDFSAFLSRPYHELLQFLTQNPVFADAVLPHIQPQGFWTDELTKMLETIQESPQKSPEVYPQLVDTLYNRSGMDPLNILIDKAERARIWDASMPHDAVALFTGKKTTPNPSTNRLMGFLQLPELPDWSRVNPALIGTLKTQKDQAESALVFTLLEKVEMFPDSIKRDPLTFWMPLVKLATSEPEFGEKTPTHYSMLQTLYAKASALAYDGVMGKLFEVEYAEYLGDPMDIPRLDQKIREVREKIKGVERRSYPLPNGAVESSAERLGRYYSTIGHLLTRKYGVAISAMTLNTAEIVQIEAEVEDLLQERRDKTTIDEALVYADTVNIIASAWASEGGMMTQKLMMEGLPAAREELTRLAMFQKRFETLCNGHLQEPNGVEQLQEKMADIRWKIFGEACFRAGLPKQGLASLNSEPHKYQGTKVYTAHIRELGRKYPWLVEKDGKISRDNVGDHGKEAVSITEALFYSSRATAREIGLPIVGAAVGSLGGPPGAFVGGYVGKGINHLVNSSTGDAPEILSQVRATGIPLISEGLSEQLSHAEYIDLATCGVSSLFLFRFYRSALSLTRAASQASFNYVMRGGLRATARASAQHLTIPGLRAAGRSLGSGAANGIKNIPSAARAVPGKIIEAYGKSGVWPTTKYMWTRHGVATRLTAATGLMASDWLPDHEFNTWAGPLGASLLINDIYGKYVWGWDPNGGMVGFAWRYGFELGVQAMQGISITKPRMDYTVMGMLASYTLRGVNKLYTLGRAETRSSPVIQGLAHFVEGRDVLVPRSVTGLTKIKASHGMVRGLAMRIGKPVRALNADLPDGTILRVKEVKKTASGYVVHVVRKMTASSGKPVAVVTDRLSGVPIEEVTEITLPRASILGRVMSRTVHNNLSEAGVYRVPNIVMKTLRYQPNWWVELGKRVGTPGRPIFNFRGSIANAGDLPILALAGGGFGVLQDSDPKMTGLYRASDYGIAFFFQHKVQHLFKIDSPLGSFVGYTLGIPFAILSLPLIFPTIINQAPGISKKDEGYFDRLAIGDEDGANEALQSALTSLCPLANAPVVGQHVWNKVTPLGAVADSYYRIEEVGAVAYWGKMLEKLKESKTDRNARVVMEHFIDKVARDSQRYLVDQDLPEDPVKLRLLVLELAFVKRLMRDKSHRVLMNHAQAYGVLKNFTPQVPTIRTDADLKQMVTGLNINERVGTVSPY